MIIAAVLSAVITLTITKILSKRKEKQISVVVMSDVRKQSDELFIKQLGSKIPLDFLRIIKHSNGTTEYQLKIKK